MLAPSPAIAVLGIAVIALTLFDFFWTTLSVRGAGPLTSALSRLVWKAFRVVSRVTGSRLPLLVSGPCVLALILVQWIIAIWLGWFLVFMSAPDAVLIGNSDVPAAWPGRLYFAGFSITTLGVGDLRPGQGIWQVLTALASLNGIVLITIGITYILSVMNALVDIRAFATQVQGLGASPEEIVANGWNGRTFAALNGHLALLVEPLARLGQLFTAYPILRAFHSEAPVSSLAPAIALLDDCLTLLEVAVDDYSELPRFLVRNLGGMIDHLIVVLDPSTRPYDETLPNLTIQRLQSRGIRVDDEQLAAMLGQKRERRSQINKLLWEEGWRWAELRQNGVNDKQP